MTGTCAYSVFFESPPLDSHSASRYTALPHPFVLDLEPRPDRDVAEGGKLRLEMNLIGPAIDLLPYLIQTMDRAGEWGIGRAGGRFALREVFAERGLASGEWRLVYDVESGDYRRVVGESIVGRSDASGTVQLDLQSPLRVKRRGRFVGPAEFAPEDLLRNLLTRLSRLAALYGRSADLYDWNRLSDSANAVSLIAANLQWADWTRFSSRQRTTMQMGGLVGQVTLSGPGLAACWPALWLGQWTHVGKGTSFGLGRYRIRRTVAADAIPANPEPERSGIRKLAVSDEGSRSR